MNQLHRQLAPMSDAAWAELDAGAVSWLTTFLAARKLVAFHGPQSFRPDGDDAAIALRRND